MNTVGKAATSTVDSWSAILTTFLRAHSRKGFEKIQTRNTDTLAGFKIAVLANASDDASAFATQCPEASLSQSSKAVPEVQSKCFDLDLDFTWG